MAQSFPLVVGASNSTSTLYKVPTIWCTTTLLHQPNSKPPLLPSGSTTYHLSPQPSFLHTISTKPCLLLVSHKNTSSGLKSLKDSLSCGIVERLPNPLQFHEMILIYILGTSYGWFHPPQIVVLHSVHLQVFISSVATAPSLPEYLASYLPFLFSASLIADHPLLLLPPPWTQPVAFWPYASIVLLSSYLDSHWLRLTYNASG